MANGIIGKVTAGGGTHLVTSTFYGTCTTAANVAAKIVKLADATPDSATLITGMLLAVKFTNGNTVANPTLTVQRNGNTTNLIAAKPIMLIGSTAPGTLTGISWRVGAMILFVFDGTNWVMTDYNNYAIHQNAAITTDGTYNLLSGYSANTNEETGSVNKLSGLTYNPNTNALINTGTDTGGKIYLSSPSFSYGFLNGSVNHGIYDSKTSKWVLMGNASHEWYGNFNANGTPYLTCSTAAATAAKAITYSPFNLQTGSCIYVVFTNTNTKKDPTLNVNSTGPKEIWCKGVRVHYQSLAAGFVYRMVYDGTHWQITNEIIPTIGNSTTAVATAAKTATINGFIPYTGAEVFIKFTNTNSAANPTLNINSYGAKPILWMGLGQTKNNRNTNVDNIGYKTLRNNHVYHLKYDGTSYHVIDDTFQHYATSGVTAVAAATYTQADYDQYVTDNGTAPSWAVGDVKTPAVAEVTGNESLAVGNPIASNKNGGMTGRIILYGPSTVYHTIQSEITGTSRVMHIPNYAGDGYLTHTAAATAVGTATQPVYVAANGRITEASTYAGGSVVKLNNTSKAGAEAAFYAPTAGGTAGQYLKAVGATSAPTWANFVKPTVAWTAGTTAGPTLKVTATGGTSDAVAIPSAAAGASGIVTTGAQTLAGAKTFTGDMTISKSTTIANNYPATLNFSVTQTDNNKTTGAYIKVYDDADNQVYGTNMVIQSQGAVIVGGGESPSALYSALGKTYTGENLFLTADGAIFAEANANTIANRLGVKIETTGAILPVKAEAGNNRAQDIGSSSYRWNNIYAGSTIDVTAAGTSGAEIKATNDNGIVSILASTNRGLYDRTKATWIIYNDTAGDHTYAPHWASKGSNSEAVYFNASGEPVTIETADLKAGKDASGNVITSTYATKTELNNIVAVADALVFRGTLAGAATTTYTPVASRGDTYKVSAAGLINGERVEIGDLLICTTDNTAAATSSNVNTIKANWAIVQNNVDGAVFKSTNTFTDGQILVADGTNGKIKTSGFTIAKSVPSDAKFTDTNYYHTSGSWSGLTYTATANGEAGALAFTIPTGTTATTVAVGNHEHTIYPKWQTTTKKSTELYDYGFYVSNNQAAGTGPTGGNYFTILNLPYRKASGNTKADWGWQIGGSSSNDSRLFYRTTGDNVFSNWQEIAHGAAGTAVGSATQPVYMSNTGVITAGTALKALAYKDSLTKSDVGLGNVKNQAITVTSTSVSDGTNTFSKYTHPSHTAHSAGLYKVTIDALGHVTAATAVAKADITGLGIPGSDTDTKNTAGSTNSDSKLFLIGATSQAANPQTYSDSQVYTTNGQLDANKVRIAENVTLTYNSTTQSLDFIFA